MDKIVHAFRKKRKEQSGVVFLEAAIVFPVMFFVLFFLIFTGNLLYQRAQIESEVEQYSVIGAAACADSMMERYYREGSLRLGKKYDIDPYRFLKGNSRSSVVAYINGEVAKIFNKRSEGFFMGMRPVLRTGQSDISSFSNYYIYGTFNVEVEYEIAFPIRFIGEKNKIAIPLYSSSQMPVSFSSEFIRNVDMVTDYLEGSGALKHVSGAFNKVKKIVDFFD